MIQGRYSEIRSDPLLSRPIAGGATHSHPEQEEQMHRDFDRQAYASLDELQTYDRCAAAGPSIRQMDGCMSGCPMRCRMLLTCRDVRALDPCLVSLTAANLEHWYRYTRGLNAKAMASMRAGLQPLVWK